MKELRKYDIQFHGLGLGNHVFEYKIDKSFFDLFQFEEAEDYDLSVKLDLEKQNTLMVLNFSIKGTLVFPCDLCIEMFNCPFAIKERQIIKFGEEAFNQTEEIDVIPFNANFLNVARYIYEFVALAMPTKRIHPNGLCNTEMLEKVQTYKLDQSEEDIAADPRWDALKKLKF